MNYLNPEIKLEKELAAQIYDALQGDVVKYILKHADETTEDEYWRSRMEGHCMKADKDIADNEVNFIYNIGRQLGLSPKEISLTFAGMIQQNFTPSLDAIS